MRGEHFCFSRYLMQKLGSSPHARGARKYCHMRPRASGIIPACAGSTMDSVHWRGCGGDHPRMRGEHARETNAATATRGSSPHARGAQNKHLIGCVLQGIIPACAGSTNLAHILLNIRRDHPRMRGEHYTVATIFIILMGSSPHARGALSKSPLRWDGARIIPACAGSTPSTPTTES